MNNLYLKHHGIKGQRWGIRRYQNPDGSLTAAGRLRLIKNTEKELSKIEYGRSNSYVGSVKEKYDQRKKIYIDKIIPSYKESRAEAKKIAKEMDADAKAQGITTNYSRDNEVIDHITHEVEDRNRREASRWLDRFSNMGSGNFGLSLDHNEKVRLKNRWINDRNRIMNNYIDSIGKESINRINKKMTYSEEARSLVKNILNGEDHFGYRNIAFEIESANGYKNIDKMHKWGKQS